LVARTNNAVQTIDISVIQITLLPV
jgi:hypothetical protein